MNAFPDHTARLVARLLDAYCQRVCPPSARHAVPLAWTIDRDRATLYEVRRFCGVPGAHRRVPIAQFRYRVSTIDWTLHRAVGTADNSDDARWIRYAPRPTSHSFIDLLRELDADPAGLFWGRINGKSLRWCSARGRCEGCDERYCDILGVRRDLTSPATSVSQSVSGAPRRIQNPAPTMRK